MIRIGTVHDISAEIALLFTCGKVITKAAIFWGSLIIYPVQVCCQAPLELSICNVSPGFK